MLFTPKRRDNWPFPMVLEYRIITLSIFNIFANLPHGYGRPFPSISPQTATVPPVNLTGQLVNEPA
jgi:hypothetical protein